MTGFLAFIGIVVFAVAILVLYSMTLLKNTQRGFSELYEELRNDIDILKTTNVQIDDALIEVQDELRKINTLLGLAQEADPAPNLSHVVDDDFPDWQSMSREEMKPGFKRDGE